MHKEIIRLLKSSNPVDRIMGIKQLSSSGHEDTVKILGALYKRETDNKVKQVITEAARSIKQKRDQKRTTAEFLSIHADQANPIEAQEHLERAMHYVVSFDMDEAWIWAKKAFKADPSLAEDEYAVGLAAEITGVDRSMAVETLIGGHVETTDKPKRAEKSKARASETGGWGKVLLWIFLFGLVNGVVAFIPMLYVGEAVIDYVLAMDASYVSASAGAIAINTFAAMVGGIAFVISIISMLINLAFVHFTAIMMLGGDGQYSNLVYKLRFPMILQAIVAGAFVAAAVSTIFTELPTNPEIYMNPESIANSAAFEAFGRSLVSALGLFFLAGCASILFNIWMSINIGQVYKIGGLKGCGAIIIAGVIMGLLNGGINMIFSAMSG